MIGITHVTYIHNPSTNGWIGRKNALQGRKAIYLGDGFSAVPLRVDEDKFTVADAELLMGDLTPYIIATVPITPTEFMSTPWLQSRLDQIHQERKKAS